MMKKLLRKGSHKDKDKENDPKEKHEKDKKKHKKGDKEASTSSLDKHSSEGSSSKSKTTVVTKSSSEKPGKHEKTVKTTKTSSVDGLTTSVTETKETSADGVTTITKETHNQSHKPKEHHKKHDKVPEPEKITSTSSHQSHSSPTKVFLPGWDSTRDTPRDQDVKKHGAGEPEEVPSKAAERSVDLPKSLKDVKTEQEHSKKLPTDNVGDDDPSLEITLNTKGKDKPSRPKEAEVIETVHSVHTENTPDIDISRSEGRGPDADGRQTTTKHIITKRVKIDGPRRTVTTTEEKTNDGGRRRSTEIKITSRQEPKHIKIDAEQRRVNLPRWLVEVRKSPTKKYATIDHSIQDPTVELNGNETVVAQPKPEGPEVIEEVNPVLIKIKDPFVYFDGLEGEQKAVAKSEVQVHVEPDSTIDFELALNNKPVQRSYKGAPVREGYVHLIQAASAPRIDLNLLPVESGKPEKKDGKQYKTSTHIPVRKTSGDGGKAITTTKEISYAGGKRRTADNKTYGNGAKTVTTTKEISGGDGKHRTTDTKTSGNSPVNEPRQISTRKKRRSIDLPRWLTDVRQPLRERQEIQTQSEPDDVFELEVVSLKESKGRAYKGVPVRESYVHRLNAESAPRIDFSRLPTEETSPERKDRGRFTTRTQITTTKIVNDGEKTVITTTKEVSDDRGKKKTTETTTSDKREEPHNVAVKTETRKTELPGWLVDVKSKPSRRVVDVDHSIQDPHVDVEIKNKDEPKPKGPEVIEEINPIFDEIKDPFVYFEGLEGEHKQEPKQAVQTHAEPEEVIDFEVTKREERSYRGDPVREGFVHSVTTESSPGIDFSRLDAQTPDTDGQGRFTTTTITTKKTVSDGGKTVTTTTKEVSDEGGRRKTTETKTQGDDGNTSQIDMNFNVVEPPKKPARKPQKGGEMIDIEDEFLEEIVVMNKKRKVRLPKNFIDHEAWRPERSTKSLDSLVESPKLNKKQPVMRRGDVVNENVKETKSDNMIDLPDLDLLGKVVREIKGQ